MLLGANKSFHRTAIDVDNTRLKILSVSVATSHLPCCSNAPVQCCWPEFLTFHTYSIQGVLVVDIIPCSIFLLWWPHMIPTQSFGALFCLFAYIQLDFCGTIELDFGTIIAAIDPIIN